MSFGCSCDVVVEAEKSKSSKKRTAKAPWAKLISQCSQVCYFASVCFIYCLHVSQILGLVGF